VFFNGLNSLNDLKRLKSYKSVSADIVPRTDVARGLAIIGGVGGQLFLAVVIARLVSLYARGKTD
jgi:hypothetical protein